MKDVPVRGLFGREDLVPIENPKSMKKFLPEFDKFLDQRIKKKKKFRLEVKVQKKNGDVEWLNIEDVLNKKQ